MNKSEILNETIAFYGKDKNRRAEVSGSCSYVTDDGRNCALGRCLLPRLRTKKGFNTSKYDLDNGDTVWGINNKVKLDVILSKKYRGHSVLFWTQIQELHDDEYNWSDSGGLSDRGQGKVKLIEDKIAKGELDD